MPIKNCPSGRGVNRKGIIDQLMRIGEPLTDIGVFLLICNLGVVRQPGCAFGHTADLKPEISPQ